MKAVKLFFIELWQRIWAETPKFFKIIRNFFLSLGGLSFLSSLAIEGLGKIQYMPTNWTWIEESLRVMAFVGFVGSGIAQLAKVDKKQDEQNQQK